MQILQTMFEGVNILQPDITTDERGHYFEAYNQNLLPDYYWVVANQMFAKRNTICGLHYQKGDFAQAKLVRVIHGLVNNVVVDLRAFSDTYGKALSVVLSGENNHQLIIPRGFAHGFGVLSQAATIVTNCDNQNIPAKERGLLYNDPELKIDWKIPFGTEIVSAKDLELPTLENIYCK